MTPPLFQTQNPLSRRQALAKITTLSCLPWLTAAAVDVSSEVTAADAAPAEMLGNLYKGVPGPWGTIQYYHFYLEAPEHLLAHIPPPSTQTRWTVPQAEAPRIEALLMRAGLPESTRNNLLDPRRIVVNNGLFSIFPDAKIVADLPTEARNIIYNYLSRFPQNSFHVSPLYVISGSMDEWSQDTGIRPELVELMTKLSYTRSGITVFSDIPLVLSQARDEPEARALVKKFTRVRTILANVEVTQDTDPSQIIDYWSTGMKLRRKDVDPLIRAACRTAGVHQIDLLHLLPPLPRKLLYTYPDLDMAVEGRFPDCHWTSLNFFNYSPQAFYLNERLATSAIKEHFTKVEPPYQYGDILIYMAEDESAYHSCVYLGADLVFTKNGRNILIPWTLAHLKDVTAIYAEIDGNPLHIDAWRPNPDAT